MMSIETIDMGDRVICDMCGEEWTGRPESGGFLFGSKATCPTCGPALERDIVRSAEEHVRARCPAGVPFATWVLSLRGGDNTIRILSGADARDALKGL